MTGPYGETGIEPLDKEVLDKPLVTHVADEGDLAFARVAEAAKERGVPIRMRMAVSLWDFGQYVAWRGQTWKVEAKDKGEAEDVRNAIEEFFDLLAVSGPQETGRVLAEAILAARKQASEATK